MKQIESKVADTVTHKPAKQNDIPLIRVEPVTSQRPVASVDIKPASKNTKSSIIDQTRVNTTQQNESQKAPATNQSAVSGRSVSSVSANQQATRTKVKSPPAETADIGHTGEGQTGQGQTGVGQGQTGEGQSAEEVKLPSVKNLRNMFSHQEALSPEAADDASVKRVRRPEMRFDLTSAV